MSIKINTNISKEYQETIITVNAPEMNQDIQNLINYISNINIIPNQIVANDDNKIYFIDLENIICFFSKNKYNYVRTKEGTYRVRYKLYELEDILKNKNFIRISNSCIINMNQVKYFDTSILGTISVYLKDSTHEVVSKRYVSEITKILKQRRDLK